MTPDAAAGGPDRPDVDPQAQAELGRALGALCVMFETTAETTEAMLTKAETFARQAGADVDIPLTLKARPEPDPGWQELVDNEDYAALLRLGWNVRNEMLELEYVARKLADLWE